ncbi:MAG: Clp protease N-terminal domain-containing protein [Solirubrobacteraceae bacterium]
MSDGCDPGDVSVELTDEASKVLLRAQDEARAMGHPSVEGEHILLGLLWAEDGIPGSVFADLGIRSEPVRDLVRNRLEPGFYPFPEGPRPLSSGARKLLEVASGAARAIPTARGDRGEALLGSEHLLLAVTRLSDSGAHQILCALDADPNVIRSEVKKQVPRPGGRPTTGGPELRHIGSWPLSPEDEVVQPIFDSFLADPVAQRLLVASSRIAFEERRAMFGLRDLLRALARDEGALRLLARLGVELDGLRERLDTEPPAAV